MSFMLIANLLPLLFTWKAYGKDGIEAIGWPFHFFERGGVSYSENLWLHWLVVDAAIALSVSILLAYFTHRGFVATFHYLRTWGTPWAEQGVAPDRRDVWRDESQSGGG